MLVEGALLVEECELEGPSLQRLHIDELVCHPLLDHLKGKAIHSELTRLALSNAERLAEVAPIELRPFPAEKRLVHRDCRLNLGRLDFAGLCESLLGNDVGVEVTD